MRARPSGAVTAAVLMAFAFPLGAVVLMSAPGGFARQLQHGGVHVMGLCLVLFVACCTSSALGWAKGPVLPPAALALPFLLLPLVSYPLTTWVLSDVMTRSFPALADEATLSVALVGEVMAIETACVAFSFAGVAASTLAAFALSAENRRARVLHAAALAIVAGALLVWFRVLALTADDFLTAADGDHSARLQLVIDGGRAAAMQRALNGCLMAGAFALAAFAFVQAGGARVERSSASLLIVLVTVFTLGARATETALRKALDSRLHLGAPRVALLQVDGELDVSVGMVFDTLTPARLKAFEREAAITSEPAVALTPGLTRETLLTLLRTVREPHAVVRLTGARGPVEVPGGLAPLHQELGAFFSNQPSTVAVSWCEASDAPVRFAEQHWQPGAIVARRGQPDLPYVSYEWGGSPEELARAASLALANGHQLCLVALQ